MTKIEGKIKINDGFLQGHYYKFSKTDNEGYSEEVKLKYLAFKDDQHIFIDEDEYLLIKLDKDKHLEHIVEDFGYENLDSINWLNWRIEQNSPHDHIKMVVSTGGRSVETTLSLDYEIKRLAKQIGVNL